MKKEPTFMNYLRIIDNESGKVSAETVPGSIDAILMGDLCDVFDFKVITHLSKGEGIGERNIAFVAPYVSGHEDVNDILAIESKNFDLGCRRETGWPSFKGLGLKGGSPIPQNASCSSDLIVEDSTEQIVSDSSEQIAHEFDEDNHSSEDNIALVAETDYGSSENRIAHESEIASDSSDHNIAHESEIVTDSDNNIADATSEPLAESFSDDNIADALCEPKAENFDVSCDATSYTSCKPLSSILFLEASKLPNVSNKLQSSIFIETICNKACANSCSEFVRSMGPEDKNAIVAQFEDKKKYEIKNILLAHLKSQKLVGLDDSSYIYLAHSFCIPAFSQLTGISNYLVSKVLSDLPLGLNQYTHGSAEVPRRSQARLNFISWMVCYSEIHGQADPEKVTTVLPAFLNKSELFKIYLAEAPEPLLKSSTFYYLVKKEFGVSRPDKTLPNIRFSKYSSHSKDSYQNFFSGIRMKFGQSLNFNFQIKGNMSFT